MAGLTFSAMNDPIRRAVAGTLQESDLKMTSPSIEADVSHDHFQTVWDAERRNKTPSLLRALRAGFLGELLVAAGFKLAWGAFIVLSASYFVRSLLTYLGNYARNPSQGKAEGWILSVFFFVCCMLLSMALQQMASQSSKLGLRVRAALTTAVYRKSLCIEPGASDMDVVALVSNDCTKLMDACTNINFLWSGVLEALAIVVVLLVLVGRAVLPGLGLLLLLVPIQYTLGVCAAGTRKRVVVAGEARTRLMDEILRAAKLVKAYAWEESFAAMVDRYRTTETKLQERGGYIKSVNLATVFALPPLIAISIFAVYVIDTRLDGITAFTTLSLFNTLRLPLVVLPKCLRSVTEAIHALARLQTYLLAPEVQANASTEATSSGDKHIRLQDATFTHGNISPPLLRGMNIDAPLGTLVMICGGVGAGKSNLCQAVLGQMKLTSGSATTGGCNFAYVPQAPWCQFGTVRENILFGRPYEEQRYQRVLYACALTNDLEAMPEGDATLLGERGVNISGGQKQRIALARAAYSGADAFVLDGPLSAVDMHTCQHIFKHGLRGLMRGRTIVLVTHQVELLPYADVVVLLRAGASVYTGPYAAGPIRAFFGPHVEIPDSAAADDVHEGSDAASGGTFPRRSLSARNSHVPTPARTRGSTLVGSPLDAFRPGSRPSMQPDGIGSITRQVSAHDSEGRIAARASMRVRAASKAILDAGAIAESHATSTDVKPPATHALRPLRRDPVTHNAANPYWILASEVGIPICISVLLVFTVTQLCRIYSDIWISTWVARKFKDKGDDYYLFIYGMYIITFIALLLTRGMSFFTACRRAARGMHARMFAAILRAPLRFFTVTPLGGVLSVFARDVDALDEALQDNIHMTLIYVHILGTTMGVVIRVLPYFAIVSAVLMFSFAYFFRYYIAASRVLKQATGDSMASLTALVSESQQGLAVIHAFRQVRRFEGIATTRLNRVQTAGSNLEQLQVWLSFRLDSIGCLLVLGTCLIGVGADDNLTPALAGLAISNAFQILLFFSLMVRTAADVDSAIASVQRMDALAKIEPEADKPLDHDTCPPDAWPQHGAVEFHNVVMSYAPELPHVLKGVSFSIQGGEKIGVCGRTGAGKSSSIMALFRLAEISEGAIRIDGIDIKALNLRELRRRIAILPQEPVMFQGTARSNLDPFGERSDEDLWTALRKCHLHDTVSGHPSKLEMEIAHGGANLSVGQMQLFCLARALLNPSKLLVLDEATAALDLETDALVQNTIRTEFADRTIICIAHRLDSIIDCDRILVMSDGGVVEFAPPYDLLQDDNSVFSLLCRQAGPSQYSSLRAAATQHHLASVAAAERLELLDAAAEAEEEDELEDNEDGTGAVQVDAVQVDADTIAVHVTPPQAPSGAAAGEHQNGAAAV